MKWLVIMLFVASGCSRACDATPPSGSAQQASGDPKAAAQPTERQPAVSATAPEGKPIGGRFVGQQRVRPGEVVSRGAPPEGAEVVLCVQQTHEGRRSGQHCQMRLRAGEGGAITGVQLHEAMEEYIGGTPYGELYHQRIEGGEPRRGAVIADAPTSHADEVVEDDEGRYLLFVELARG